MSFTHSDAKKSQLGYFEIRGKCGLYLLSSAKLTDLDVLVNNAGYGLTADFNVSPTQDHVDMINVHCTAPTQFAHQAVPCMKERSRGAIINVSSISAFFRTPPVVMYTATKEYVNVFSEMLQANLVETGIKVQSLCPGFTYTSFHDVESMSGFDRKWFPDEAWMTAEEVVSLSLGAVKNEAVICITGKYNQDQVTKYLAENNRF